MSSATRREADRGEYAAHGYVLLEQLFPPLVLQIFHAKLQQDLNLKGNPAFVSRTELLTKPAIEVYSRQYAPMATFHWGLTPVAAEVAGCELVPTYAYFRAYQEGDKCLVHSDRQACEHSLSLTLHLADERPWALSVERRRIAQREAIAPDFGEQEYTSLPMKAGDAVMYRGVEHRHGRLEPNPNTWSAHLFLHWVDAHGPYADHAFDRVMLEKHGLSV
ncbi:MAG TPA: hypothetical protein VJM15_08255 [Sphingomicrobium sp.]|nr:hypothetical protein [Sphingomicrobium sp.]